MNVDEIERLAQACVVATQAVYGATNVYARYESTAAARVPYEDLGERGADVLALIERLRAAEARASWQPMDTAPRDFTEVLVCIANGPSAEPNCVVAYRVDGCWFVSEREEVWPVVAWMPLPEPPRE